ncbi:extensin-like domain-containing protein [Tabrizicola oligotrophica]|uniref:Extensin family protein n=1 Tax=Tabrizicola oligotrophica TaxID=2710650 RepID=A0A6M0QVM3_9RHOB|nr:extensin family protein [Tabrizicola oligotrophica]NEY91479.1 extensin family protein [Tabrizicola oligotrophica]
MRGLALCLALSLAGQGAGAEAPATSPRPMPRLQLAAPDITPDPPVPEPQGQSPVRPKRRPDLSPPAAEVVLTVPVAAEPAPLRPRRRPDGLNASFAAPLAEAGQGTGKTKDKAKDKTKDKATQKGSVCGDPEIKGEVLAAIKGKVKGCGIEAPVRVTAISGIRLNQPATISCETATAFKTWIEQGMRPAMGKREVVEIRIAASYICRPRNNKKGAKISEHGRGRALDVAGFVFSDGTQWSVARDYNSQTRKAHKAACGIFGTTLGPGSDGYHEDHLHFDIAGYRSGPYCK